MKMSEFSVELEDLPTVEAVDITNYLVLQTSYYTRQQMKAYKSLEAYNFFVSRWVSDGIVSCDCHGTGICEIKVILQSLL